MKKPAKKKMKAADLVKRAKDSRPKSTLSWYDKLPADDRKYTDAVIFAAREDGDVSVHSVSILLKEELGLETPLTSIKRIIGNMIRNG